MDSGRPRSLPDHGTPAGDHVYGEITIKCFASGALSVEGPIENKAWALAVLENAKDVVRNYRAGGSLVVAPAKDVTIEKI